MTFSKNIYACKNVAEGCKAALRHDLIFADAGIEAPCPECQSTLVDTGKKKYHYNRILTAILLPGLIGIIWWMIAPVINPPQLQHIHFEQPFTRVKEADAIAQVVVRFHSTRESKLMIQYSLIAGTATSVEDFNDSPGQLIVYPGQDQAVISVAIVPDRNQREPNETFEIVLNNVEGQPRHTVIIEEEGVNPELLQITDVLVADLSRLAADIANDYVTIKMLENYLKNSMSPDQQLVKRYDLARTNILRARERYLLHFNDALHLDPVVIDLSIENRLAAIKRENAELQYRVTLQMKQQLNEYLKTRIPQADLWIEELGILVQLPTSSDDKPILQI
jgi:hypothetical protein